MVKNSEEVVLHAIGGYEEVGKNMSAVQYGDELVILDMGLYMDRYITLQDAEAEDPEAIKSMPPERMISAGAIPDDTHFFKKFGNKVKAIVLGHAHLDHIGSLRWTADKYKCPIIASPYTIEIIKAMARDDKWQIKNKLVPLNLNSTFKIGKNLSVELVAVTHSLLQAAMTVIHTPKGDVVYTLDYKFDYSPILIPKTNMSRLKEIGQGNVLAVIVDCTRVDYERHTFSESIAREMLKDVLTGIDSANHAIIVTTFSSHLPRLKSVIDFGKVLGREVVFVGRSLNRYITAAENLNLVSFSKQARIASYSKDKNKIFTEANKNRGKYILVMTGNQGEPNAVLSKVANGDTPFQLLPGDFVIFACETIPTPTIESNRRVLEQKLKRAKARVFKDVHTSGHGGREDDRDLLKMLNPDHVIPAHGDTAKLAKLVELAGEMGYKLGKTVHILQDGQDLVLI